MYTDTMKKSVLVTGVSGTGKSTTCLALQDLGYKAIDIESVDGLYELIEESTRKVVPGGPGQIKEGLDWNCNKVKLKSLIIHQKDETTFYCGGMANTDEVWDLFNKVIVLTVSDETTIRRLSSRNEGEFGNTHDNRKWVLSWKHDIEQHWLDASGMAISAEDEPIDIARAVVEAAGI